MLNLYCTRYWVTPLTETQERISLVTARALITAIISFAARLDGGSFGSFSNDMFLAVKLIPDSILLYLPSI